MRNLRRNPKLCVMTGRDARSEQGGVFDAQGVVMRGTVELSTDETLQEEVMRKMLRRYVGDEGEPYLDALLQDRKPGKNRVSAQIKPETLLVWDFRTLEGAGGYATA